MKYLSLILFVLISHLSFAQDYSSKDLDALMHIKTTNDLSDMLGTWGSGQFEAWEGVEWSTVAAEKRVTALRLNNLGLSGVLLLDSLKELRTVEAHGNLITNLNVVNLTKLDSISASENPLKGFYYANLNQLSYLNFDQTVFIDSVNFDFSHAPILKELIFSKIDSLKQITFTGQSKLETLILSENKLSTIDVSTMDSLKNLHLLSNSLDSIDLSKNLKLEKLDLASNNFKYLDLSISQNLKEVYLAHNQIDSVKFKPSNSIEVLDVEGNELYALDFSILTSLNKIYLKNNHLSFGQLKKVFDIKANLADWAGLNYYPQKMVQRSESLQVGDSIDYSDEYTVDNNRSVFVWYKNGVQIPIDGADISSNGNFFTFKSSGTYLYKVTNSSLPSLEITTQSIQVSEKPSPSISMLPIASSITYSDSLSNGNLTGGSASVLGSFVFMYPDSVLNAGLGQMVDIRFTPIDFANYNTVDTLISIDVNQKVPNIIASPSVSSITYGDSLSSSSLTGGTASVPGSFAFVQPTSVLNAGLGQMVGVRFTPIDFGNYSTVDTLISIDVKQIIPSISAIPSASSIVYGDSLSKSILSGDSASVLGNFSFVNPDTVFDAGIGKSVSIRFNPTDAVNYVSVDTTTFIDVAHAQSKLINLPVASTIVYGDTLSKSTLSGGNADVPGTFGFMLPDQLLDAGVDQRVSVRFNPTDDSNYAGFDTTVSVDVDKAIAKVSTLPSLSPINIGESLARSAIGTHVSDVSGSFVFKNSSYAPSSAGIDSVFVSFLPDDTSNYKSTDFKLPIQVDLLHVIMSVKPVADTLVYGEKFSAIQLRGGNFFQLGSYTLISSDAFPDVAKHQVNYQFVATDSNYAPFDFSVEVVVKQAVPSLGSALSVAHASYGNKLSELPIQGGTPSVNGSFSFKDKELRPEPGIYTYDVIFEPKDKLNYASITSSVGVEILKLNQVITWNLASTKLKTRQSIALAAVSDAGLLVSYNLSDSSLGFIRNDSLFATKKGTLIITAGQAGNSRYDASPDLRKTIVIEEQVLSSFKRLEAKVYPVPSKDYVYVSNAKRGDEFRLCDFSGRLLQIFRMEHDGTNRLSLSDLSLKKGTYFLHKGQDVYRLMIK